MPLGRILKLIVDEREQLGALRLVADALDHVRRARGQGELKTRMFAEAALVAKKGVELLVVDVAAVPALVGVVATMLADSVLVRDRA